MAEFSVFDKLVANLSTSERRDMLERIVSNVKIEPREAPIREGEETIDVEASYREMGLLRRLIIVILAALSGRDRLTVVEGQLLGDLRRRTAASCADFDSIRDQLKPSAVDSFRKLAANARHFAVPLARVMGRERSPFIAFLAGLHAPDLQQQLLVDSDPFTVGERQPELNEGEVKRRALLAMEEALVTLPAEIRRSIYHDVRALHHLMALASFPFERFLSEFCPVAGGDAVPVPLNRVAEELGKLGGILMGLYPGPSAVFLEALSLYQEQDRLGESDEDVEGVLERDVHAGNAAYSDVVEFASRYPAADLARLAHSNLHWRPVSLPGGEDWFAVWRTFWHDRTEKLFRRYSYTRKMDGMMFEVREALELKELREFPGYPPSGLDGPARHGLSMGIVRTVLGDLFPRVIQGPLMKLFNEGDFYKPENRTEFDQAIREMERIRVEAANLEVRLQPTGDLGMLWQKASEGALTPEMEAEQRQSIAQQVDADASAVMRKLIQNCRDIANLLQGVLYGTVGGPYDTISNLAQIGGGDGKQYLHRLETVLARVKAVGEHVADFLNLESSQQA